MNNPYLNQKNNSTTYLIDWLAYSAIFFVILLPFLDHGWLKVGSVALILGFFAGILNRFFREYYALMDKKSNVGLVNRVTGRQHDPTGPPPFEYNEGYTKNYSHRSLPDSERPPGERAPD